MCIYTYIYLTAYMFSVFICFHRRHINTQYFSQRDELLRHEILFLVMKIRVVPTSVITEE